MGTSLQQPLTNRSADLLESIKIENSPRSSNMAALRAQFFQEKLSSNTSKDNSNNTAEQESKQKEIADDKHTVLDRRKSADTGNKKLDALTKGNHNDIKSMFEEHIAVKKGLIPDPNLSQGPVVKMRRKVNPNLPTPFKKFEEEEDTNKKKRNRESVPIDRKMFNHFLNKFEDDQSREAAKRQCWNLTQKQKNHSVSWSKKQEEAKLLEEKKTLQEEIAAREAEAENKRLEKLEEERIQREKKE